MRDNEPRAELESNRNVTAGAFRARTVLLRATLALALWVIWIGAAVAMVILQAQLSLSGNAFLAIFGISGLIVAGVTIWAGCVRCPKCGSPFFWRSTRFGLVFLPWTTCGTCRLSILARDEIA